MAQTTVIIPQPEEAMAKAKQVSTALESAQGAVGAFLSAVEGLDGLSALESYVDITSQIKGVIDECTEISTDASKTLNNYCAKLAEADDIIKRNGIE